ncbi:MAG: NAD-dependent epimerase/dehydratase family protein [Pseudolabrys sp.]
MSGLCLPERLAETLRATDHRLIVTGAGGWIGSATLDMFQQALGSRDFKRRVFAFASNARGLVLRNEEKVALAPLEQLADFPRGPALIFHYAFLGREKAATLSLEAYCAANGRITEIVRGTVERLKPAGMFLTSSGAVYRPDRSIETELAVNPYGVLKRRDEAVFDEVCGPTGTKLVTARVFNLSGEYINKLSSYALSSFILDALAGQPIRIQATRRVERSYIYVGDVVSLAMAALLDDAKPPPPFDTAGDRVVELDELARLVSEICRRAAPIMRPAVDTGQSTDRYVGDPVSIQALAAKYRLEPIPLPRQIRLTADYLREKSGAEGGVSRRMPA